MRYLLIFCFGIFASTSINAQFVTDEEELMIMVSDGTDEGKHSNPIIPGEATAPGTTAKGATTAQAKKGEKRNELVLDAPIRALGMTDCIQAAAFLERPSHGILGFMLIFSINDSIAGRQASLTMPDGKTYQGVYRLVRQKSSSDEKVPDGMTTYSVEGTFFLLGVS